MFAVLHHPRLTAAILATVSGSIVCWLAATPFGLLAPLSTLLVYARGRSLQLLNTGLLVALIASALSACTDTPGTGDATAFFAVSLSVGAVIATNVSAFSRAEATLHTRERELSLLVDIVPSHLWRLMPDGQPTFFNRQMSDYLGLEVTNSPDSARDGLQVIMAAVHPDDAPAFRETLTGCLSTGNRFSMRYRLRRTDGAYHWMSSRAAPLRDKGGCIIQWYGICHDIDDEVRAQGALRESEQQLRQLIDAVPALIWCTTPEGTPSYVNKRLVDTVGVTLDDLIEPDAPRSLADVHPDDREMIGQALTRSFETGTVFSQTYRQRRSDGVYRWTEGRAEPLRDPSGSIVQWYGVCVDIHDLVTTQAALRDRERELSQLVDMVPSCLWRLSPDGEPTFFNKRLIDFFGLDIGDVDRLGRTRLAAIVEAAIHPDDAMAVGTALRHCFATGERFSRKYRLRRADGAYRWVEGIAEPLRDISGRIVQWYGLSHDIDDQLRTETALRERERSLSQLVETLPAMIDCAAPNGEPIYRSRQLREFLGYDLEELDKTGQSRLMGTLESGVHPDDLAGVKEKYSHSLSTGLPYARRHRLRRFDGEYRWVETRAAAMRDATGAIVQWNVICLDIDGEVRAQEELRLARERLARASQAASLAELSASIAHEVNQPLAAVMANSHACQRWLAAEPPNLGRAQKTVDRVIRDANAAADVVSRIRALFKQSAEVRARTAFDDVITEAVHLMAEEAERRRIRMDIDIEEHLPLVSLDRVQIQQVLINLARNAMEAMDEISGARILGIRVRRAAGSVRTDISDLGPGIEWPEKMFEPFFTTKTAGLGMGLAICRSIVESHGGRLWADKNEPCGAKLVFTLPLEGDTGS